MPSAESVQHVLAAASDPASVAATAEPTAITGWQSRCWDAAAAAAKRLTVAVFVAANGAGRI